jgi:ATP-dependent helicase/nuclease subunit A
VERTARQREELNGLYVAMTRAREQLVISSVAPRSGNERSWWQRLEALATPIEVEAASALDVAAVRSFALAQVPALPVRAPAAAPAVQESLDSRLGQAMHRLLETMKGRDAEFDAARLRRVAREFALDERDAQRAAQMAKRIAQGEGAWAWDDSAVDWQANEVPLNHGGELLRIDRLVRHAATGEWWVLDYKSAAQPELQPELISQMQRYRDALQAIQPQATVRAAFLTAQGRVVHVP